MIKEVVFCTLLSTSLCAQELLPLFEKSACMLNQDIQELLQEPKEVFIFLSFSMPEKSLRYYLEQAEGAEILFRGLPKEGLGVFVELLKTCKNTPSVSIRPDLYEGFSIRSVPAFVVRKGAIFDKVSGEISIEAAFQKIEEEGELAQKEREEVS